MRSLFCVVALNCFLVCSAWAQTAPPSNTSAPNAPTTNASANASSNPLPRHEEQLVVTGTYGEVPLQETDRSVSVIEVTPFPGVYRSWADALAGVPSLDLQQRVPGTAVDLSIRGTTFEETLILVNGLRLNDVQTGHNNLDIPFPFASVERIEVLRGAGSTLYGSDAMGGAVNFITATPKFTEVRLGAGVGNWGTNQQNGAVSLLGKRLTEQLAFTRELSTGFTEGRDYRNLAVASEMGLNTALGRSSILLALSDRPFGAQGFYGVPLTVPSWERTKGWFAAWAQPFGEQTSADFAYRRHTDEYIYVKSDPSLYENNHIADYYQASLRRFEKIGSTMRVFYGADGIREHIESNNLGTHTRDQGGVYASFDARALKRFSLTAGVREQFYTAGHQVFSPSLSGAYWLNSHWKLRASASHAFRLPDYTELYYTDPSHRNNPNLAPESSWSFEGGVQVSMLPRMVLDAAVFHHHDRDVIDYAREITAGAGAPYTAGNIHTLNFTGAEIALRWQLPWQQRVELSYTGMHGEGDTLPGVQYLYSFNYPVHEGVATWWGKLPGGIDSRLRVEAIERYQSVVNPQGAYALVDCTMGRQFRYATPYLQLTNLTDTRYQVEGLPMPGRGFLAGLELHWRAK